MAMPEEEKRGVPAYMVSFGDMITLLLTFFILLVALADTQSAGLVGAGKGTFIEHMLSKGSPGIMSGRLREDRVSHKKDLWWVPSQEGDPDELELVKEKLDRELQQRFRPDEASITYHEDRLALRLPARILYEEDTKLPVLTADVLHTLRVAAREIRQNPQLMIRINGDVEKLPLLASDVRLKMELTESAQQARMIYENLLALKVPASRMSLWGWGSSRPIAGSDPGNALNQGVTIELVEQPLSRDPYEPGDIGDG